MDHIHRHCRWLRLRAVKPDSFCICSTFGIVLNVPRVLLGFRLDRQSCRCRLLVTEQAGFIEGLRDVFRREEFHCDLREVVEMAKARVSPSSLREQLIGSVQGESG